MRQKLIDAISGIREKDALQIAQITVLRPHRRIIETGTDRMREHDLTVIVLQHKRPRAL